MDLTPEQQAARTFLQDNKHLTAVIASVSKAGLPHAATIYYYTDDALNFYFLTATGTQKYDNLLANPKASIVIGTGPELTTMQGFGTSTLLEKGSDEEAVAMVKIKKRLAEHDGTWPIFQLERFDDETIAVFKFVPESLVLLNLEDNCLPVTASDIKQII